MIDFYYAPTPNGWKVAIMLEECQLEYTTHLMRLGEGDQFTDQFLRISPNAKMPAIVDHETGNDPVSVFESGAILVYLAEKTGSFIPTDPIGRKETLEWLFWQVGTLGPMAGQLSHFVNYAPEDQRSYGAKRYRGEYERALAVLDRRLANRPWILGEEYSIADMIAFPWAFIAKALGSSLDEFPRVADWRGRIKTRPAVVNAINLYKDQQNQGENNASNNNVLFNQTADIFKTAGR